MRPPAREPGASPSALRYHGAMQPETPSPLVLVSKSPRRRRLLAWLGMPFEADAVDTPEDLDSPLASDPKALAVSLAVEKAEAARARPDLAGAALLCCDTVVVLDGTVLGKPADAGDARRMLAALSGRTHQVVTGCALWPPREDRPRTFPVVTDVRMRELSEARIAEWMGQGTYLGCAGAYNIEAQIAEVTEDECFENVAGLPLCHLYAAFARCSPVPEGLRSPVCTCDAALGRTCRLGPSVISEA